MSSGGETRSGSGLTSGIQVVYFTCGMPGSLLGRVGLMLSRATGERPGKTDINQPYNPR